ncbi:MAG TPA: superoxide dismutase family protein [Salinimicrobium sp.]|nr:superoxide dismutase family protein [Salinimicrobium sp.]
MKQISLAFFFSAALIFTGCKNENNKDTELENDQMNAMENDSLAEADQENRTITVQIESKSGSEMTGEAVFTQENGEVTMTATLSGLPEGMHAIHLHEKADCSAEDASSAGGHWNPTMEDHGKWGDEAGYHRGDIGNFDVDAEGNGSVTFTTDQWCIGCDDEKRNIVGKAVVVHDGVDDYTSQPSGAAGNRIGCGVIEGEGDQTENSMDETENQQ